MSDKIKFLDELCDLLEKYDAEIIIESDREMAIEIWSTCETVYMEKLNVDSLTVQITSENEFKQLFAPRKD